MGRPVEVEIDLEIDRGNPGNDATGRRPGGSAATKRVRPGQSVFDNRRGLLLTAEQLAGPAAPNYLLRRPYVYSRQNLL